MNGDRPTKPDRCKACQDGKTLQMDKVEPWKDVPKCRLPIARNSGIESKRGEVDRGKSEFLDRGKSCWVRKSKMKPRWIARINSGVIIGKVRIEPQLMCSIISSSDTDDRRGPFQTDFGGRGESSKKKQGNNQEGFGLIKGRLVELGQPLDEPIINGCSSDDTYQSDEEIGVLKAQSVNGSGFENVTHVSPTKSSACPVLDSSDTDNSLSEENEVAVVSKESNPVEQDLDWCVDLSVHGEDFRRTEKLKVQNSGNEVEAEGTRELVHEGRTEMEASEGRTAADTPHKFITKAKRKGNTPPLKTHSMTTRRARAPTCAEKCSVLRGVKKRVEWRDSEGKKGGPEGSTKRWDLGEEIDKIVETSVALGFDFSGIEQEIFERLSELEKEDDAKRRA